MSHDMDSSELIVLVFDSYLKSAKPSIVDWTRWYSASVIIEFQSIIHSQSITKYTLDMEIFLEMYNIYKYIPIDFNNAMQCNM